MDPMDEADLLEFSDEDSMDMDLELRNDELLSHYDSVEIERSAPIPDEPAMAGSLERESMLETWLQHDIPWNEPQKMIELWLDNYREGTFGAKRLREFWRFAVLPNFCPQPGQNCLEPLFDEATVSRDLIRPLEQFICGGTAVDPDKTWEHLSKNDNPPALCGRVFRMGEPTYSCRDCGADPTCVLCVDCFRNSEHKQHRYKMSTSVGGGYCDCGDSEAWRSAPRCSLHQSDPSFAALAKDPEARKKAALDRLDRTVSPNMADRCRQVIDAVLAYADEMLGMDSGLNLPLDLRVHDGGGRLFTRSGASGSRAFGADYGTNSYTSLYVTAVYNDESHTFEQVIQALQRALDVGSREAVDLATCIDREGRSIVRCASFQVCNQAQLAVERATARQPPRPLKVSVLGAPVVAHQAHALRLLHWLKKLMGVCEGFRVLLADVVMKKLSPESEITLLEDVLLSDTQRWKAARAAWHRLFIAGLLMDPDAKRDFAQVFTRRYGQLMQDFIIDDHDHSHSVTSLSVQLFTVPTLAQHLMAHHDALAALLQCFLNECERRKTYDGKLSFERNQGQPSFRRAMYMLYDIKYLLSAVPLPEAQQENISSEESYSGDDSSASGCWNEALRKGFLHGLNNLLSLLVAMEGMDSVVRQSGQHMEFEAEWEAAFNLHCKLAPMLTLIVQWCASDKRVLLKASRAGLKKLQELQLSQPRLATSQVSLLGHSLMCANYDVSSQPVSVHLPLTRIVSGFLLALPRHRLHWNSHEFDDVNRPTLQELLEPPLRLQVLMAQVQAGMWRRNGYALINQLYFYQNVRCRTEMYDRDIVLLQLCAALMGSNEFLLTALHRFALMEWIQSDFDAKQQPYSFTQQAKNEDDKLRQTLVIAEEFLRFIITLAIERYTPGIGQVDDDDCLSHEVIHLLCIESQGHAALNRALPEDAHHETGLERVVDRVAVFRKPAQGAGRGVFSLKPELYHEYNVYHYHYSREDQSRSEENVRQTRRSRNEEDCCPPPTPAPLAVAAAGLSQLLNCTVILHIEQQVLLRTANLKSRSFTEPQLQAVLHLIGLALREEEPKQKNDQSGAGGFSYALRAHTEFQILSHLEALQNNGRVEAHRHLLSWTIRKFRSVLAAAQRSSTGGAAGDTMEAQSSSSSNQADETEAEEAAKKRRAEMAAARRAAIMAQISAQQKSFIKEHAQLFKETENDTAPKASVSLSGSAMDLSEPAEPSDLICIGPNATLLPNGSETSFTCIVCQEEQRPGADQSAIVLAAFVQRSSVLRWRNTEVASIEVTPPSTWPYLLDAGRQVGTHVTTCGHAMHAQCWQKHFHSLIDRERRRSYRHRHSTSYDVEKHEFLCPLCKGLSNAVIPILPSRKSVQSGRSDAKSCIEANDIHLWIEGLTAIAKSGAQTRKSEEESTKAAWPTALNKALGEARAALFRTAVGEHGASGTLSKNIEEMAQTFSQSVFSIGLESEPDTLDPRVPVAITQASAFTILATESLLEFQNHSPSTGLAVRQEQGLRALLRFTLAMESLVASREALQAYAIRILRCLLLAEDLTVLQVDAFSVLLGLLTTLPSFGEDPAPTASGVPPLNTIQAWHAFRLALLVHVAQIVLTWPAPTKTDEQMDVERMGHASASGGAWRNFWDMLAVEKKNTDFEAVESCLLEKCLPFLRSCGILFHFLGDCPFPRLDDVFDNIGEAHVWLKYLNMASLEELVAQPWANQLAQQWGERSRTVAVEWKFPIKSPGLIALPSDYSELINAASLFTCPNSEGDEARTPAMCLVCGQLLCSQSYCCQTELGGQPVGACTAHAHVCGLGACLFLRVRECKLLLLAGRSKGCFLPPPYVDAYGETDQGLRRGDPLHLCETSLRKLEILWRSHGLYNEAAKCMENSQSLIVTDWHHL